MNITDILTNAHLSQTELSKRFGIPLRTIQHWAEGTRQPSDWVVNLIAAALQIEDKPRG